VLGLSPPWLKPFLMPKSQCLDVVTSIESIGLWGILLRSRSGNMNVKAGNLEIRIAKSTPSECLSSMSIDRLRLQILNRPKN
jgi:hypothetical protein